MGFSIRDDADERLADAYLMHRDFAGAPDSDLSGTCEWHPIAYPFVVAIQSEPGGVLAKRKGYVIDPIARRFVANSTVEVLSGWALYSAPGKVFAQIAAGVSLACSLCAAATMKASVRRLDDDDLWGFISPFLGGVPAAAAKEAHLLLMGVVAPEGCRCLFSSPTTEIYQEIEGDAGEVTPPPLVDKKYWQDLHFEPIGLFFERIASL